VIDEEGERWRGEENDRAYGESAVRQSVNVSQLSTLSAACTSPS
jgi:hypothetical protein